MSVAPVTNRIVSLDALRGFAVLGVLVINIIGFALPPVAFTNPLLSGGAGALNHGIWSFTTIFVEGSFRGLFSAMFGASVILFTSRGAFSANPIRGAVLYYRRTMWLLLFGLVHAFVLLMPGDILVIYALAGLVLFPIRNLAPKRLILLASVLLAGFVAFSLYEELPEAALAQQAAGIKAAAMNRGSISSSEREVLRKWEGVMSESHPTARDLSEQSAIRTGDFIEVFSSNAEYAMARSFSNIAGDVLDAIMMMFIGMAFHRWGILTGERNLKFYVRLMLAGYLIGLSFRIWTVTGRWEAEFSPALWAWQSFDQVGRTAMTMGHIGMFFTIWHYASQSILVRALTAAGRMALSNYIGQTVIANLIFTGIGLSLYGVLDRSEIYTIMLGIWAFQLVFSYWWLNRYQFGPLEWLWRGITYWRTPPFRKRS